MENIPVAIIIIGVIVLFAIGFIIGLAFLSADEQYRKRSKFSKHYREQLRKEGQEELKKMREDRDEK